ncbi:MAG: 4,5-DOPA dioxygenase extradiol [Actinomycetota bacterium]|nr:4,5-DOPA dioxygenase extradiol [Actinomycetota bacterium]
MSAITSSAPVAFIGHGSPMNALDVNRYTDAWRSFGAVAARRPRALLVISAHWYINATAVTAMDRPRTIHDFYGFPAELFAVEYDAPGAPDVAGEVVDIAKPTWVGLDLDSWGLDHGTWSVLAHAFPDADVPVVQLAIDATKPLQYHVELGSRLAPLREQGVMIIGSGNVVHNLRRIDWRDPDGAFDWTRRFEDAARTLVADAPGDAARLAEHPDFDIAHPSPDHFIPFLYVAGLAAAADKPPDVLVEGFAMGSLSMTSWALDAVTASGGPGAGAGAGAEPEHDEPAAALPDPAEVPPESTNT